MHSATDPSQLTGRPAGTLRTSTAGARMPERPLSRAALSRENRRLVYEMACDADHKKVTPIVTNADQTVISRGDML
jgi:hypothetical protein